MIAITGEAGEPRSNILVSEIVICKELKRKICKDEMSIHQTLQLKNFRSLRALSLLKAL